MSFFPLHSGFDWGHGHGHGYGHGHGHGNGIVNNLVVSVNENERHRFYRPRRYWGGSSCSSDSSSSSGSSRGSRGSKRSSRKSGSRRGP